MNSSLITQFLVHFSVYLFSLFLYRVFIHNCIFITYLLTKFLNELSPGKLSGIQIILYSQFFI